MSLSTLKPIPSRIPPVTTVDGSNSKASKVTMMNRAALPLSPLQVKENFTPSRRQMMQSLTAASSIGLLSLVLPAPAQARPRNTTMRQKIMEKFEELRRKAGLSNGGGEKPSDGGEEKPKLKAKGEEKKSADGGEKEISLPNVLNGKTVETTLP